MLMIERMEIEAIDPSGILLLRLFTSEGQTVQAQIHKSNVRDFKLVQNEVVRQSGLWVHHPCESGKNLDRLAWKKILERAATDMPATCRD